MAVMLTGQEFEAYTEARLMRRLRIKSLAEEAVRHIDGGEMVIDLLEHPGDKLPARGHVHLADARKAVEAMALLAISDECATPPDLLSAAEGALRVLTAISQDIDCAHSMCDRERLALRNAIAGATGCER